MLRFVGLCKCRAVLIERNAAGQVVFFYKSLDSDLQWLGEDSKIKADDAAGGSSLLIQLASPRPCSAREATLLPLGHQEFGKPNHSLAVAD